MPFATPPNALPAALAAVPTPFATALPIGASTANGFSSVLCEFAASWYDFLKSSYCALKLSAKSSSVIVSSFTANGLSPGYSFLTCSFCLFKPPE
jgi:hypothetical protein